MQEHFDETYSIYKYIHENKGFKDVQKVFLEHFDDYLFIDQSLSEKIYLTGKDVPSNEEITNQSRDFLSNLPEIFMASGYSSYIINDHNNSLPTSRNNLLRGLFTISSSESFLSKNFSKDYLNQIPSDQISMLTANYSNKLSKLIQAMTYDSLINLFDVDENSINPTKLDTLFKKKGDGIYRNFIMGNNGSITLDDFDIMSRYFKDDRKLSLSDDDKNKINNLYNVMDSYSIDREKASTFLNTMLLYQSRINLYDIKTNSILNCIEKHEKPDISEKGENVRIYKSYDDKVKQYDRENDEFKSTYRIYMTCDEYFAPVICHVKKDILDSYLKDKQLSVDDVGRNSYISENMRSHYPIIYKVFKNRSETLRSFANNSRSSKIIKDFAKRICPTDKEKDKENIDENILNNELVGEIIKRVNKNTTGR